MRAPACPGPAARGRAPWAPDWLSPKVDWAALGLGTWWGLSEPGEEDFRVRLPKCSLGKGSFGSALTLTRKAVRRLCAEKLSKSAHGVCLCGPQRPSVCVLCTIVGVHEVLTQLKLLGGHSWEAAGARPTGSKFRGWRHAGWVGAPLCLTNRVCLTSPGTSVSLCPPMRCVGMDAEPLA